MVYFIRNTHTNNVKIGSSDLPPNRLKTLQTGNDCRLVIMGALPGGKPEEVALHRRFDRLRVIEGGKEWFRGTKELYDAIRRLLTPLPRLFGHEIESVYLAGKITGDGWRNEIYARDRMEDHARVSTLEEPWFSPECIPVPGSGRDLNYTGPFWLDVWAGHGHPGAGAHAFGELHRASPHGPTSFATDGKQVRQRCLDGVSRCSLVFAWIETEDCHGTIAEITWAYSMRMRGGNASPGAGLPLIVIATPLFPDVEMRLWFVAGMADHVVHARTPSIAWDSMWNDAEIPNNRQNEVVFRFDFEEEAEQEQLASHETSLDVEEVVSEDWS